MQLSTTPWTSLEIVRLLIAVLTPLTVAGIGWFFSRSLKRFELIQWSNQKLIEKRLVIYDSVAPLLNNLLCFYTWVGHWKDISPADVIKAKRDLDKAFNIYRYLFDDKVYQAYRDFFQILFETYVASGQDALIRSDILSNSGDRKIHCSYTWDKTWETRFSTRINEEAETIQNGYYELMELLRQSLGVHK